MYLTNTPPHIHTTQTLSLRNTCHLLNDAAIAAILAPLSLRPPDQAPTAGGGGGGGVTGLRALHLGTSTRRGGARPPASELTDATLHLLATCCPRLENLNIHNQVCGCGCGYAALDRIGVWVALVFVSRRR